jgi:peroxiredoxin
VAGILTNKRTQSLVLILVIALAALAGLLLLMGWLASPDTPAADHTSMAQPAAEADTEPAEPVASAPNTEDIVATVNETDISRQTWQQATQLDAVMSNLARQPVPTAEETLDRLVNEVLVLDAVPDVVEPAAAEVSARIETLTAAWNVSDQALSSALGDASISQDDLNGRVAQLLKVEAALGQLAAQEVNVNAWLAEARASAEIGVYRSLANLDSEPAEPQPVAQPAVPQPDPPVAAEPETEVAPPPDVPVGPNPNNAAPDFSLPLLDGGTVNLSQLRGKPTVINFWATWCPPCRRELPALQAAFDRYGDQIGFVAVDVKESRDQVAPFVRELGLTFPIAFDVDGSISNVTYKVRGIPTTVFVDSNGVIVARHVGPLTGSDIDSYLTPLLEPVVASVEMPQNESGNDALLMLESDTNVADETGSDQTVAETGAPGAMLELAPVFSLPSGSGDTVSLQDYRDKSTVVLVFYRGHT